MPHDIDDTWDRIEAWLRTYAPASDDHLGVPARRDTIPPFASLVGEPLPDDLVAWWRRSCGTTSFLAGRLLAGFAPYSIDEAVECRTMMLEIAGCDDDAELADLSAEPAGTPCRNWLPVWVPIAHDSGGDLLFVDLRPGPERGCVTQWYETEFAMDPVWPSVAAMLAEIADALEHGTEVAFVRPKVLDDGTLGWA